jgi:hypothetical protein
MNCQITLKINLYSFIHDRNIPTQGTQALVQAVFAKIFQITP